MLCFSRLRARAQSPSRLGNRLVAAGLLSPENLALALDLQAQQGARLGEILVAHDLASRRDVLAALAAQYNTQRVDLTRAPCDASLSQDHDPRDCLALKYLPWRRQAGTLVLAVTSPDAIARVVAKLPPEAQRYRFVIVDPVQLDAAIHKVMGPRLARLAETRVNEDQSCRTWSRKRLSLSVVAIATCVLTLAYLAPQTGIIALYLLGVLTLCLNMGLKLACLIATRSPAGSPAPPPPERLPKISVLVPLFEENRIAEALLARLGRLDYPAALLEVALIVEARDLVTRAAIAKADLPPWMRVIKVPEGGVQTKPRAMNYALDFTQGEIVGVYDAEDAPAPDQLRKVAARFAQAPDDLACLQGKLSFYNPKRNWFARCFTFEYAGWFRIMLPGLERLGLAIPLGGTTLFFRRKHLEALGGWDAHNVTEDADLGIRLARHGYRSEILDTVTQEEANCRFWPWVRQRSRWLKGYAVTWAVHMRAPRQLWRDLGARKFFGFQVLFLGTLAAFGLAPILWWTAICALLSLGNPVLSALPAHALGALTALFILAEIVSCAVFIAAARQIENRPALLWIATLPLYFAFASVAAYKGLTELFTRPFYWDKTQHGTFGGDSWAEPDAAPSGDIDLARVDLKPGDKRHRQVIAQRA